ncbi:sulfur carrier protein ThiS [Marinoscillum sp. MHG1-6]|uniref:sulfur carrier protein ThiS n=1 Tax=Marinoscillum sp. MHG1-6 TaxID=2959627 RepID=UPI002156FDAF|nr:sulfur carrier protein ThiS [Marinoscillum sp. MHG1-6]
MFKTMITVNVNNQHHSFDQPLSLQALLEQLSIKTNGIAVAVDNQVVSRSKWTEHQLEQDSKVLIIKATQGG